MINTPILLIIFNRPEITKITFDLIRAQQPKLLFIAADGPRANSDDKEKCEACKSIVAKIDWDCEVKTLYNLKNSGCGAGPAQAITWFFEHVEEGIILEDDCCPNNSFFKFCEESLRSYRDQKEIMMICGTSYQERPLDNFTYYYSRYGHVWGWATWKDRWKKYSYRLDGEDDETLRDVINRTFTHWRERKMWFYNMKIIINGLDAWDYQWMYCIWKNNGLTVIPWKNMISNIGFGKDATHTLDPASSQSKMKQFDFTEIIHPKKILLNKTADRLERYKILIGSDFKYFVNKAKNLRNRLIGHVTWRDI